MGLPSGILWSTCNLGAEYPWESGLFYQQFGTVGYARDEVSEDNNPFSLERWQSDVYPLIVDDTYTEELDAVRVALGSEWRMATYDDWQELFDNCTLVDVQSYLDSGFRVILAVSRINGRVLSLPYTGWFNGSVFNESSTSTYGAWYYGMPYGMKFSMTATYYAYIRTSGGVVTTMSFNASLGLCVRGVRVVS